MAGVGSNLFYYPRVGAPRRLISLPIPWPSLPLLTILMTKTNFMLVSRTAWSRHDPSRAVGIGSQATSVRGSWSTVD